ncbi:MAG: RNA polymerase sigma factor [Acidimicrobiales bacterium]
MEPQPWTDADDQALIVRISRGDRAALDQLYRVHAGWVIARLQRRCGEAELVDSALQDTFLAIWKSAKKYKRKGEVAAWIWGIAVRRLIDQMRKRKPTPFEFDLRHETASASAEQQLLDAGIGGELGDAFEMLDPELRDVLVATAVDGLSTKEAGTLLGIPQGTVKTRLMRAREQMREQLA